MDEQGGAGGVPLDDDAEASRRRKPHPTGVRRDDRRTPAADTDEASRLDRPQEPDGPRDGRVRWTGPREE
ncbi:hypothetical protein [Streptomyces antimicrobicus]|uniref:Ppx/GppA family phosphatase n=1 Tax=Streptomyces antimicrobicus TaxID=2883108 RepID=A0ABS8BB51_9ACTN|nr:hypothetical protein [Streptomyces antimicrobicus]MCB5181845.1 hypothetical protein [Streptomyces antimicrobicus]